MSIISIHSSMNDVGQTLAGSDVSVLHAPLMCREIGMFE